MRNRQAYSAEFRGVGGQPKVVASRQSNGGAGGHSKVLRSVSKIYKAVESKLD